MKALRSLGLLLILVVVRSADAQSPPIRTYVNPVIPGDHPDPTLTKIGDWYYTSGSSFNPTPRIYRSADLVHWEVIAQPVEASWPEYGDAPAGGIWGGHMVHHGDRYWHFFGKSFVMYFVTAPAPEGPWSAPVRMTVPPGMSGLGADNSIFIDEDDRWYLLVKNGQSSNYILELGPEGHPNGNILDLTWLNPQSEGLPYGWAEGPVMWTHDGVYYYSFAQHLAGNQYVMWSDTLSDDKASWSTPVFLFETVSDRSSRLFRDPNHSSPAVIARDGTSWLISQSYLKGIGGEWMGQGRQPALTEVTYDAGGRPTARFPANGPMDAPDLPSLGIPWMVPKSDMFDAPTLSPEWSFLGQTGDLFWSVAERPGWLRLRPTGGQNTVIKNDAEWSYSMITRVDFHPLLESEDAGLWVFNGLETLRAELASSVNASGEPVITYSFDTVSYAVSNDVGSPVWLKIEREGHVLSGFYGADGDDWHAVGQPIDVRAMDGDQPDFGAFTGTRQGPFTRGRQADFDLYIYRDAYSVIPAQNPANHHGVTRGSTYLSSVNDGDWALYAGVEFGTETDPPNGYDYQRTPGTVEVMASSATAGGTVELWIDSLDTGTRIAQVAVQSTGSWTSYDTFVAGVDSISGRHDLYVRFSGSGGGELLRMQSLRFRPRRVPVTIGTHRNEAPPQGWSLDRNFPNPARSTTTIAFDLPRPSHVRLALYDVLGRRLDQLVSGPRPAGRHEVSLDTSRLPTGSYVYALDAGGLRLTQTMAVVH
jgi:beta-xylosidase